MDSSPRSKRARFKYRPPVLPPDPSRFLNPFDDSALLGYYHELGKWHGFVRFLGLPQLKDNPDVPLARLYVEPFLTPSPVALHASPRGWQKQAEGPLAALVAHPRLVVLGDPGSGKSTLVSWVALELARSLGGPFQERLGPLVPLPMILRDLDLGSTPTWDGLIEAFLRHPVARDLSASLLHDLFERGQAFPMLDGLDEIGSVSTREALREAVIGGVERYPSFRFLLTSRVVGYEQVPFQLGILRDPGPEDHYGPVKFTWAYLCYVAPFTDEQIERFGRNWYTQREVSEPLREQGVKDLLGAINGSETTLGLARNPVLLTLMALIHRVERTLPHGRVLLFDKITAAYLETIDTFRGLNEGADFSLAKKKRWLAAVAFGMQLRRLSVSKPDDEDTEPGEILATEADVLSWLGVAMNNSAVEDPVLPRRFLDYIGRRSGLLVPRGEGVFSFVHLSFQEYFAAWHIAETIATRTWLSGQALPGLASADLARYANDPSFSEVFVLLFELLAERGDWGEVMAEVVFGGDFANVRDGGYEEGARAFLLAAISVDPYTSWPSPLLETAWRACWQWELRQQDREFRGPSLVRTLFGSPDAASGWPALLLAAKGGAIEKLNLEATPVTDLTPLVSFSVLTHLDLSGTGVKDVTPLVSLTALTVLALTGTGVTDVTPIGGLKSLIWLDLSGTGTTDVTPLAGLTSLRHLDLSGTNVTDVSSLAGLKNLTVIR